MAAFALLSWPFIGLVIFARLGLQNGLIWVFLLGYLFLPQAYGFDLPGLPPYHKTTAIAVACALGVGLGYLRGERPVGWSNMIVDPLARRLLKGLVILGLIAPMLTVLENRDPIVFPEAILPGLGIRDYISMVSEFVFSLTIFGVAWLYLSDKEGHGLLLKALVLCGLFYSLLALFELRMSPQLHTWVYGYFQHIWDQHLRGGGFRPIVFLYHGLHLGFFLFAVTISAFALARSSGKMRYYFAGIWLLGVLLVSRNLGASAIGIAFVPLMLFAWQRLQLRTAAVVAILLLTFPAVRQVSTGPLDTVLDLSARISVERAASLKFRFDQEDSLMERAKLKPVVGWGVWARWRIKDERGNDISTVDGTWIGIIGERGWAGYVSFFGLMVYPIILMRRKRRYIGIETIGLALILTGNFIYMIPNSAANALTWFVAGALAGFVHRLPSHPGRDSLSQTEIAAHRTLRYSRYE